MSYSVSDGVKKSDLNIDGAKDLHVDIETIPSIIGAVITDALKASDLNIDPAEKLLEVALADAITRILLNTILPKLQTDVAGRLLVKIDVTGTATPVTLASTVVSSLTKIIDFPYLGYDHEKILAETAFQGIRGRMVFA